jgi:pSer/pThr/pTyr-binding forkhead associated (FHA) protein
MTEQSNTRIGGARFWLVVHSGEDQGSVIEVSDDSFKIGRDQQCNLVLHDPKVSKEHAVIRLRAGHRPELQDLGSANGTFVNGTPVRRRAGFTAGEAAASAELMHGDVIGFGDTLLVTSYTPPAPPTTA